MGKKRNIGNMTRMGNLSNNACCTHAALILAQRYIFERDPERRQLPTLISQPTTTSRVAQVGNTLSAPHNHLGSKLNGDLRHAKQVIEPRKKQLSKR